MGCSKGGDQRRQIYSTWDEVSSRMLHDIHSKAPWALGGRLGRPTARACWAVGGGAGSRASRRVVGVGRQGSMGRGAMTRQDSPGCRVR